MNTVKTILGNLGKEHYGKRIKVCGTSRGWWDFYNCRAEVRTTDNHIYLTIL